MTIQEQINAALIERDRILTDLDVEAAKAFVVKHGGTANARIDWLAVLHLARLEVKTMTEDQKWESRIFLAKSGHYGLMDEPENSPYTIATLNLIFPKTLTDAFLRRYESRA